MNIVQKLSLNKHPKDVVNMSLVNAENIKVSSDESCITNEEGIRENTFIINYLNSYYTSGYTIVGIIPCNNELVIIVNNINKQYSQIFRYREKTSTTEESMRLAYDKLIYNKGKYTGTFTYNVENSLILALSEYDAEVNVPLKVINLGNFDNDNIANDTELNDNQISLVPEVKIPKLDYTYAKGRAYKGWYFVFIRYKINSVDYTQWYNFGSPIYVDNYTLKNIVKESYYYLISGHAVGFSDTFSDNEDIVNNTFKLNIIDENINYESYQLGFICSTKSYTKAFKTNDINFQNKDYLFASSNVDEYSVTNLTDVYYNYYNVKNVVNYKNRLYISNYSESSINEDITNNLIAAANNVKITLNKETYTYDWVESFKYDGGNKILNNRIKNKTLLPNGVYNFFIHFVDKYGHSTKGYKIEPPKPYTLEGIDTYITKVPFTYEDKIYYLLVPYDITLWSLVKNYIYTNTLYVATGFTYQNPNLITLENNIIVNAITAEYKEIAENDILKNVYVSQFFNGGYSYYGEIFNEDGTPVTSGHIFGATLNSNGDTLWRVPEESYVSRSIGKLDERLGYRYSIQVSLENIPSPYVGYYISMEEYESNKIVTGYLTKRNANVAGTEKIPNNNITENVDGSIGRGELPNWDTPDPADDICFYSSTYDINDSIKLNYNILQLEGKWESVPRTIYFSLAESDKDLYPTNAVENLNGIPVDNRRFTLNNYKLAVANDQTTNRTALGTCLLIENKDNLFINNSEDLCTVYIASLYNYTNDIYINKHKTLIRISDFIYNTVDNVINDYNGIFSTEGIIVYNDNGYVANSVTEDNISKSVTLKHGNNPYLPDRDTEPATYGISYITFNIYSDIVYNSKVFNNKPNVIYNFIDDPTKENAAKVAGNIVEPINSIDLFKNPQGSIDDFYPVTNVNYTKDSLNVIQFDKTIRRSNIIQDETRVNAWRQFPIEGYKNITENKGKITNIVGIGYMFLVHTEHSLFMFDTNNLLQAVNTEVQLSQPDAFEVDYKEVFTSDLGFGGLQNKEAAIVDTFGYIFYDNDNNRLYHFDDGKLAYIDDDIVEWLRQHTPARVRFANDKYNNRLLIRMDYGYRDFYNMVISYNYKVKAFISLHSYHFDKAYTTKNNLYLQCDSSHFKCSLHSFVRNKNLYCSFDNVLYNFGTPVTKNASFTVVVNENYAAIKFLDYISYKLSKIKNVENDSSSYSPYREKLELFSGNYLKVSTDITSTGRLDISTDEQINKNIFAHFDKPYSYLGVWHYNYFRNNINLYPLNNQSDLMRIVGNHFNIEFTFANEDNRLIEFESLDYKVTQ